MTGEEVGSKERLSRILGVANELSDFGEISIVLDMPKDKVRSINKSWVEMPKVEKSDIVGYYISKMSTNDIPKLMKIYEEYNNKVT